MHILSKERMISSIIVVICLVNILCTYGAAVSPFGKKDSTLLNFDDAIPKLAISTISIKTTAVIDTKNNTEHDVIKRRSYRTIFNRSRNRIKQTVSEKIDADTTEVKPLKKVDYGIFSKLDAKDHRVLTYYGLMLAGAVARSAAATAVHPLNVIKTMLQTKGGKMPELSWRVLSRGAGSQFIMSVPHGAINFAVTEVNNHITITYLIHIHIFGVMRCNNKLFFIKLLCATCRFCNSYIHIYTDDQD